jgi:hypothetical protein
VIEYAGGSIAPVKIHHRSELNLIQGIIADEKRK